MPGLGPLHYRPLKPFIRPNALVDEGTETFSSGDPPRGTQDHKDDSWNATTAISLYLYHEKQQEPNSSVAAHASDRSIPQSPKTILLQVNRDSDETLERTLKRLHLNLMKKLQPNIKKKKNKKRKESSEAVPEASSHEPLLRFSVHKLVPSKTTSNDGDQGLSFGEEWADCLHLPNCQVWEAASHTPLAVRMEWTESLQTTEVPSSFTFLVEANTPTITSVQTFEDFQAHIFVGVPLFISACSIFSKSVRVDWYCESETNHESGSKQRLVWEHQQEQQNTPCFIPEAKHIGKRIAVILKPVTETDNHAIDRKHFDEVCGSEEAYIFERSVQGCPENLLLSLRGPQWTQGLLHQLHHQKKNKDVDGTLIRVMTYNVLADQNAFADKANGEVTSCYKSYVSPEILAKRRRLPLVLHEILSYQADVICLQEVDPHIYTSLLEPILSHFRYRGFFSPKRPRQKSNGGSQKANLNNGTNDTPTNQQSFSVSNEGCAMFWSLDRFEHVPHVHDNSFLVRDILQEHQRMRNDPSPSRTSWNESTNAILELLENCPDLDDTVAHQLGHVVQIVPLRVKEVSGSNNSIPKTLVATNTHLFFHPFASHIRVIQALFIAKRLSQVLQKQRELSVGDKSAIATVLCGDFNSGLMNAGGQLLMKKHVGKNSRNLQVHLNSFKYDSYEDESEISGVQTTSDSKSVYQYDFPSLSLPDHHEFPDLASAMVEYPPVTHCVDGFWGTLDHILMDSRALVAVGNAPMPTLEEVQRHTAMPSENLPSDHVSLVVDLRFDETQIGDE